MEKRELVAMFMESPFYFDLRLKERMELLRRLLSCNKNPRMIVVENKKEKKSKIIVRFIPSILVNQA